MRNVLQVFGIPIFWVGTILWFGTFVASDLHAQSASGSTRNLRVMTFNILQGGGNAGNVGFADSKFGGSRIDEIVDAIEAAKPDIVGVQEDCRDNRLLDALGDDWRRQGSIYARLPLSEAKVQPYLTAVKVHVSSSRTITVVNCHWLPPRNGYGPDVVQAALRSGGLVDSGKLAETAISRCTIAKGPRGYDATLNLLRPSVDAGETVILTGDFNEPSHLDWTAAYAEHGQDRWVKNPTPHPMRFAIEWPGSSALARLGMIDSYRMIHPNEVTKPGFTWTPSYDEGTPGRRHYHDQCLDRIDRIYHFGPDCTPVAAEIVGETLHAAEIVPNCEWPSDHRAVVVEFSVHQEQPNTERRAPSDGL